MAYLSLYFDVSDKNVFILGTGEVACRRANSFLDKNANVVLAGDSLNSEILDKGARLVKIHTNIDDDENYDKYFLENKNIVLSEVNKADFVIIATGDYALADYTSSISQNKLLNRADNPSSGNVIVPTSFFIGDIEFSIYTGGKSPLMAKTLRKKIQSIVSDEDIMEIELQDFARKLLKSKVSDSKKRRKILYEILNDPKIRDLLKNKELNNAKIEVKSFIDDL
ncbi:bifunctional precorrin-2 dehydrogenase/sirohydrochlorin ferrochelatase [Methanobrevibacter boviskoreani]|uniref:precorrin-2 dehydrogenase/sirohydrochlorin ferrochelatase family protein n=1 Tax=Methanobrevibacter boviskoreani TaxID=1348249 RepID=UPI0025902F8A|nr:bifunctional precorrin-2 dehydrogenase/sirohydrochlorin ferrochelatase [Methanobrevibacter boviskoreani]MDY5615122.1 bifunctional precorrin-2 dehydrogenase/sirohydrochlorin ferrochelatase [Methanobrevibacter boviskoreani]